MAEGDYSHRDVVDKLGIKPGFALAFDQAPSPIDPALRERALDRAGRAAAADDERVDVRFCQVAAVRDNKITGARIYWDMMTMLGQLGALPTPAGAAA